MSLRPRRLPSVHTIARGHSRRASCPPSPRPPDDDGVLLVCRSTRARRSARCTGPGPTRTASCVVEVSPHFPRTFGLLPEHPHRIHVDEIDVLVESDAVPFVLADVAADRRRSRRSPSACAAFVPDGCTLQTGIGGDPRRRSSSMLAEGDGGDYGVHSEMFTTGLMRLHQAGKVTNARKGQFDGVSVTTFAAGTAELYEWLDGNAEVAVPSGRASSTRRS